MCHLCACVHRVRWGCGQLATGNGATGGNEFLRRGRPGRARTAGPAVLPCLVPPRCCHVCCEEPAGLRRQRLTPSPLLSLRISLLSSVCFICPKMLEEESGGVKYADWEGSPAEGYVVPQNETFIFTPE